MEILKHAVLVTLFLPIAFLPTKAVAACCSCAESYAALNNELVTSNTAIKSSITNQKLETEQYKKNLASGVLALSLSKQRTEMLSIVKNINSAGFAMTYLRLKAEKLGGDAQTASAMTKGYSVSDADAEQIISEVK